MALRRTAGRCGAFVFVPKDQPAFFEVVRRYFHRHPVAGERLDPVLLHSSGGIGDEHVAVIELNAVARIRQYLEDEAFEFQQFFLGHVTIPLNDRPSATGGGRYEA